MKTRNDQSPIPPNTFYFPESGKEDFSYHNSLNINYSIFLLINEHSAMRGTQTRDSNESTAWGLLHQFCNIYTYNKLLT